MKLRLRDHIFPLFIKAAAKRELSMLAYARRAVVSFIAHDTGEDYYHLLRDEQPFRLRHAQPMSERDEKVAGHGHGPWVITGLRS